MIILMNGKPYNLPGSRCNEKQLKKCSLILLVSSPWHWSALFNLSNHRFPRMLWWFYSSISFLWAFVHRLKQTNKPWCQESWLLGWGSSEVNALKCWRQMPGVSLYFPAPWPADIPAPHPCSPCDLSMAGWMSFSLRTGPPAGGALGKQSKPEETWPTWRKKATGRMSLKGVSCPQPHPLSYFQLP